MTCTIFRTLRSLGQDWAESMRSGQKTRTMRSSSAVTLPFASFLWTFSFYVYQAGVRADATDGGPRSDAVLHWAACSGNAGLCAILLENGAKPDHYNCDGELVAT